METSFKRGGEMKLEPWYVTGLCEGEARDFRAFARICKMVKANLHLKKYLRENIELASEMDPSGKRRLVKEALLRELGEVKV
jgi:hypothetical protein